MCNTPRRKTNVGLAMLKLENVRKLFPKTREVALPILGAAWAWMLATILLQLEMSSVAETILYISGVAGFMVVAGECLFLKPAQIPRLIIVYVCAIMEPVALVFGTLAIGSLLGFFSPIIDPHQALIQFFAVGMYNILTVLQQVCVGMLGAFVLRKLL